ncbi:Crp/Fnr family transcriptional regulator [Listeria welshimeri]|nr:Crp/Fnr family transcriptional regulator [Listeria welshimeri]
MTFLELHQFIKDDSLIDSWLKKNFDLVPQTLEMGQEIEMSHEEVIIMKNGLLLQENMEKKSNIERFFADQQIIFTTKEDLSLSALETTTYSTICTEDLFDKLEQQQLLHHFFLQVAEDFERDLEWERTLISAYPKERVEIILAKIVNCYHLDPVKNPMFPKWLKIYMLARFAKCSVTKTSMIVNELVEKGAINVKSTPWLLR